MFFSLLKLLSIPAFAQSLVTGFDTSPVPSMSKPGLNIPYVDQAYGTTVTRVTDASQITDHDIPQWVRHEYSRRPAFNSDGSYVLMYSSNGWARLYSQDKANNKLSFVKSMNGGGAGTEPNWDPQDPNIFYYFAAQNGLGFKINKHDVRTNTSSVARDLTARVKALFPTSAGMWTKEEGRPSNDGKIWCMQVQTSAFKVVGLISYNFETDTILGSMATDENPDHISTSPKGNYCVPSWGYGKGTRAYALDFKSFNQLHDTSEHSDLALTKDGREVYVYTDYGSGPDAGYVVSVDMQSGTRTRLFSLYGDNHSFSAMHLSGYGTKKTPGYIAISFYACFENYGNIPCDPSTKWFYNKVVLVELKSNPLIYNLAHTHYGNAGYWAESQASSNDDFSKILFVSSWGSTAEKDVASYMINVPLQALGGGSNPPTPTTLPPTTTTMAPTTTTRPPTTTTLAPTTTTRPPTPTTLPPTPTTRPPTPTTQPPQPAGIQFSNVTANRTGKYQATFSFETNVSTDCRLASESGHDYGVLYMIISADSRKISHWQTIGLGSSSAATFYAVCKKANSSQQAEHKIVIPAYKEQRRPRR